MRRHGGGEASPSIIHTSSIALLQERFRNLQRVKEMREAGRELNRVHPVAEAHHDRAATTGVGLGLHGAAASGNEQQPRWFLHPDLVRPSRPLHVHGRPSSSYNGHGGGGQLASPAMTSWGDLPRTTATATAMQNSSGYRGGVDVDVDTSLHL
uniref:Uncharacterized protein n=1 Tax=Leersia perrieri TaxID=77586 RepID=A0A0D9VQQ6_9ORYZ